MKTKTLSSWCMVVMLSILFISCENGDFENTEKNEIEKKSTRSLVIRGLSEVCPNTIIEYELSNNSEGYWEVEGGEIVSYPSGYMTPHVQVKWNDTFWGKIKWIGHWGTYVKDVRINTAGTLLYNKSQSVTDNVKFGKQTIRIEASPMIPMPTFVYTWELPKGWKIDPFCAETNLDHIWIITDESSDGVVKVHAKNECNSKTPVLSIPIKRRS